MEGALICLSDRSADGLWLKARDHLLSRDEAREVSGRGSSTRELRPVLLELTDPRNRWVLSRSPALNPAAVLSEVIWILNGRNDSAFVNFWNNRLREFAGDGETYYGAYGFRLRRAFGVDQLSAAADALIANPDTRQVCLSIWDPRLDLPVTLGEPRSQDIPCNVTSLLKVRGGKLEWTQIMRSNDFWLGLPFNIVQFTLLQEIVAGWIGVEVGSYHHLSDSLHLYPRDEEPLLKVVPAESIPANTDDFACVDRRRFAQLLPAITETLDMVVEESIDDPNWEQLAPPEDWPAAYSNLLRVVVAEAARRTKRPAIGAGLMSGCTNPILTLLWERWVKRMAAVPT